MSSFRTCPQPRADLVTQSCSGQNPAGAQPGMLTVFDPESQQRWHLSLVESLVWQQVCQSDAGDMAIWVQSLCQQHAEQLTPARVWAALDALSDRGLLMGRATPPASEAVTHHQRLSRRHWAVAGLAMAVAPAAFAATAAAAEEKAKADIQAPAADDAAARKQQEQERKKSDRAMQEENQKGQRSAEQAQKRDSQSPSSPDDATSSRVQEEDQKKRKGHKQQEQDHKARSATDNRKRAKHMITWEKKDAEPPAQ